MHPRHPAALATLAATLLLGACAGGVETGESAEAMGRLRKETVWAVNDAAELLRFNAGQPQRLLQRLPLRGLAAGDTLVGIDYRVARGVLYALSAAGRLYTLDTASGQLSAVAGGAPLPLAGRAMGLDFNPAADRIRVVSDSGQNLRLHPDTGAVAATDPPLAYAAGDVHAGRPPQLVAAAYTYNKTHDKLTTNYAIDRATGSLVMQGTAEGVTPAVSPNTGELRTVGALGTGPVDDAAFDIADVDNTPLAALRQGGRTRLYLLDLASGRASALGTVGDGRSLWGMAIEP